MGYYQYFKKIKENWRPIVIIVLVTVAVSIVSNTFREPLYRATARVLLAQPMNINMDMYKASQSAERLALLWAKIIKSSAFLKDVLNSGFPIDQAYFPKKEKDLRKEWAKMVDSRVSTDTSIIEINVYHPQKEEARKIANAVIYIFSEKSKKYYNLGNDVKIMTIDTPLVSERPVKPSLPLNLVLGFLVGLVISSIYIIWNIERPSCRARPKIKETKTSPSFGEEVLAEENSGHYIGGLKILEK